MFSPCTWNESFFIFFLSVCCSGHVVVACVCTWSAVCSPVFLVLPTAPTSGAFGCIFVFCCFHSGNWVLIKFARDYIQQFALEKDRQVIGSGSEQCMIGVVPWSKEQAEEESSQQVTRMWRPHGLNRLHPVTRQTPQKGPNKRRPRRPASTLCEKIMRCIFG